METVRHSPAKRVGRPLSFDREQALDAAVLQFWRTGYETTSVADLTTAMRITAPSLYTAFGDKESLFLECVDRYTNPGPKTTAQLISEAPSARQAAQQLLEVSARWFTQTNAPAGCLVASAASTGSAVSKRVRAALRKVRQTNQKALQARAERDIREGRLPRTADARALASMTIALIQGMSTLARDGASRTLLRDRCKRLARGRTTKSGAPCSRLRVHGLKTIGRSPSNALTSFATSFIQRKIKALEGLRPIDRTHPGCRACVADDLPSLIPPSYKPPQPCDA